MRSLSRPTLVFYPFIETSICIVAHFVTNKVFDLAHIFITLFFVFYDYNSINFSGQNIARSALIFTFAQIRVFLGGLARDLAWLANLITPTTIMINRSIRDFLDLEVFFVLEVFFYQSIVMRITSITLFECENKPTGHFSFDINIFFNDILLVIDILIFFIKVKPDR